MHGTFTALTQNLTLGWHHRTLQGELREPSWPKNDLERPPDEDVTGADGSRSLWRVKHVMPSGHAVPLPDRSVTARHVRR
jgi:hypothetical protein